MWREGRGWPLPSLEHIAEEDKTGVKSRRLLKHKDGAVGGWSAPHEMRNAMVYEDGPGGNL